jgi:hypothetical protein
MSCACETCRVNGAILGLRKFPSTRGAIHDAYRTAAKTWHPDRFVTTPARIPEAEEKFKRAQAAYRELTEHNPQDEDETELDSEAEGSSDAPQSEAVHESPGPGVEWNPHAAAVLFDGLPHCFLAPAFPPQAGAIAAQHIGLFDYPVAIFDLARDGSLRRFLLLASHGIILKDELGRLLLLRYEDLGRIELHARESAGMIAFWEKLAARFTGVQERFSLDLYRRNGSHFCSLTGALHDGSKTALYRYLSRKRQQFNPQGV